MISKELLKEILPEVLDLQLLTVEEFCDVTGKDTNTYLLMLSLKCKLWAYKQGHPLTIIYANNIVHVRCNEGDYEKRCYGGVCDEVSPVFEICDWLVGR